MESNKTTAELIAILRNEAEFANDEAKRLQSIANSIPDGINHTEQYHANETRQTADNFSQAADRLAELQELNESLKLANSDAQHQVRQLEAENKRLRETGQKVLEAMETLRGVVAVEHSPTLIYTAQAYLNLQQALQRKEPDDEAK